MMRPTGSSVRGVSYVVDCNHPSHETRNSQQINKILQELDQNGDGVINAAELVNMLDGVVKARRERRYMFFIIVALCVFCLLTVGAVVGLTYAVVDALKDTQVTGDTMYVKGSTVEVVRTGSAEFTVVDGVFVNRQAQALANATSSSSAAAASNTTATTKPPSPTSVMRTARYGRAVVRVQFDCRTFSP
ncbi:hypothetical protein GPECTOR_101g33 [Gonium pectorale]|uniref:EF-hand domain-containing protein n=1 Tax=Gonium pectorale TaxID=33097 RepID=A0A150FZV7_GONPE|nr:hypothetical protein GPECTOR_101g33 [Gonium pectorale]|eukprot:KXZ43132.1 hypothetical protein GPECTOR_101g33 [Gonium pectorale]